MRSHRVTVEKMALLEPGLSEALCASLLLMIKEGIDGSRRPRCRLAGRDGFPVGAYERARCGDLRADRGRVFRCVQQGYGIRQAGSDARRLEPVCEPDEIASPSSGSPEMALDRTCCRLSGGSGSLRYQAPQSCLTIFDHRKTLTSPGHAIRIESARIWIAMKGRNPLKIAVREISGGATDFR